MPIVSGRAENKWFQRSLHLKGPSSISKWRSAALDSHTKHSYWVILRIRLNDADGVWMQRGSEAEVEVAAAQMLVRDWSDLTAAARKARFGSTLHISGHSWSQSRTQTFTHNRMQQWGISISEESWQLRSDATSKIHLYSVLYGHARTLDGKTRNRGQKTKRWHLFESLRWI